VAVSVQYRFVLNQGGVAVHRQQRVEDAVVERIADDLESAVGRCLHRGLSCGESSRQCGTRGYHQRANRHRGDRNGDQQREDQGRATAIMDRVHRTPLDQGTEKVMFVVTTLLNAGVQSCAATPKMYVSPGGLSLMIDVYVTVSRPERPSSSGAAKGAA